MAISPVYIRWVLSYELRGLRKVYLPGRPMNRYPIRPTWTYEGLSISAPDEHAFVHFTALLRLSVLDECSVLVLLEGEP